MMHQSFIGKTDWFSENTEGKTDSNMQLCADANDLNISGRSTSPIICLIKMRLNIMQCNAD